MEEHHGQNLTLHTGNISPVSLRARSSQDLTQAIRLPTAAELPDHRAFTANRARVCLKLFYDPDMDAADRAEMLDNFAKALSGYPRWAVSKGFDDWERTMQRRPSPAEIGILASRAVKEITDELRRRQPPAQPPSYPSPDRQPISAEAANEILARAGFGPDRTLAVKRFPMAGTIEEAEEGVKVRKAHWSDTAAPDDPAWRQLRASRAASGLVPGGDA